MIRSLTALHCLILLTALQPGMPRTAHGQEPPAAVEAPSEGAASVQSDEMEQVESSEALQKKRRVTAGMLTIALVTATGITLLALIILGGVATRRTLRRPDEKEEPPRPWTGGRIEAAASDAVSENATGHPPDSPASASADAPLSDGPRE